MKVLMLHNKYKIRGGEDESTEAEFALLRDNGIEVDIEYVDNSTIESNPLLISAVNTLWSSKSYRFVLDKIKKNNYDILHVQNFFPILSPSIFYACKKTNTKVVMSVRNYRLICPNALMYINGSICQECVGKKFPFPSLKKKCYKDSIGATATVFAMLSIHNFLNTWSSKIDGLICISGFVKSQLEIAGFEKSQLYVNHNTIKTDLLPNFRPEDFYVYVGRLSVEKGLDILLKTFEKSNRKIFIIGDGPLNEITLKTAHDNPNITYLGKLPLIETYKYISKAKALIQPSKCHETFGRTIVEGFAHGTPVIASSLGGMTELINDGENGYLFNPYIDRDLNIVIEKFEQYEMPKEMRMNAYNTYKINFLPAENFKKLLYIYNTVLKLKYNGESEKNS
jgi:glycosyltransferase involved in cell wall biosynthesis